MKNIRLWVLLILAVFIGKTLRAEDSINQKSQHAYTPFCQTAADQYKGINDQIKTLLDQAVQQANSLNKSNALNTLNTGLDSLQANYESALNKIADEKNSNEKNLQINQYKNLLATSLLWESVNLLTKPDSSDPAKQQSSNLSELCNIEKNKNSPICKLASNQDLGVHLAKIDEHIKNFNSAQSKLDPDQLDQINQKASELFKSLNTTEALEILMASNKQETYSAQRALRNCLKSNSDCKDELLNKNSGLNDQFKQIRNQLTELRKNDQPSEVEYQALEKKISGALDLLGKNESLKNSPNLKSPLELLTKNCSNLENIKANFNECKDNIANLKISIQSDNNLKNLKTEDQNFRNKISDLKTVEFYEKLKQFISNKFQRECQLPGKASNELGICIECERKMYEQIIAQPKGEKEFNELSEMVVPILSSFDSQQRSASKMGSPPEKRELEQYYNLCKNTSLSSQNSKPVQSTCNEIASEYSRVKDIMDTQDWVNFHKKYIVDYDPTAKDNYKAYERKGPMRLIGEGLVQSNVTGKMLNLWVTNLQLDFQTDMLTQQALMQKQFMYMNDPNSPWMINYPYFQTNFYSTPALGGGGFNFGK